MGGYTRKYELAMEKDIKGVYIYKCPSRMERTARIYNKNKNVTYSHTFSSHNMTPPCRKGT